MKHLFDFGISQEDSNTELQALDIKEGDRLLCIASGGEIPLNILARKNIFIETVDISLSQIYLSKLKLAASRLFEPEEAAGFLGFMQTDKRIRRKLFIRASSLMGKDEANFWKAHIDAIEKGVINEGRFEKYLSRFRVVTLHLIGKKKLLKLMECDSITQQQEFFDNNFNTKLLKILFDFIFNPKRYKNNAVDEQGLRNSGNVSKSDFFFSRFRDFCTATPARQNYYLQYYLFNNILYPEALPGYLSRQGMHNVRANYKQLSFYHISYLDALKQAGGIKFNKFHLSNIGDWISKTGFDELLYLINDRAEKPYKIFLRYLHSPITVPESLKYCITMENDIDDLLIIKDMFPFYKLIRINSLVNAREVRSSQNTKK